MFLRFWFRFDSSFQIVLVFKARYFDYQETENNVQFLIICLKKTATRSQLTGLICSRFF